MIFYVVLKVKKKETKIFIIGVVVEVKKIIMLPSSLTSTQTHTRIFLSCRLFILHTQTHPLSCPPLTLAVFSSSVTMMNAEHETH